MFYVGKYIASAPPINTPPRYCDIFGCQYFYSYSMSQGIINIDQNSLHFKCLTLCFHLFSDILAPTGALYATVAQQRCRNKQMFSYFHSPKHKWYASHLGSLL